MSTVTVFNFVTLNGYFEGPRRDISWHQHGAEEHEYAAEMLKSGTTLLFGRVTYELMASYWPTPSAIKNDPIVAEGMNKADKIGYQWTIATRKEDLAPQEMKQRMDEFMKSFAATQAH